MKMKKKMKGKKGKKMSENNNQKKIFDFDNVDLAMIITGVIALVSLFIITEPTIIVSSVITGIFGLAVGKKMN